MGERVKAGERPSDMKMCREGIGKEGNPGTYQKRNRLRKQESEKFGCAVLGSIKK